MSPTLGPDLVPPTPLGKLRTTSVPLSRSSTSSSRTNASIGTSPAYSSSSSLSIPFNDDDGEVIKVKGLRHAPFRLEARRCKTNSFAVQLLEILRALRVSTWTEPAITAELVTIQKVSGSLTNAVFFVSCPSVPKTRTLLLRIYGASSGSLINRSRELHTLHVLSSKYHIGPRVYGTFENGRVEEYFDSTALTAADLRDPEVSSWIGARMAELHGVDIDAVEYDAQSADGPERGVQLGVKKNTPSWLAVAREVLALPGAPAAVREGLDLDRFEQEWQQYTRWLDQKEKAEGASNRVFSHNDAQYGNLLRLRTLKEGEPAHRQIIVVDFEYASPNPAPFDIANHFHEWTRRNFYRAYLTHRGARLNADAPGLDADDDGIMPEGTDNDPASAIRALAADMERLESQVRAWSPASHGMWAVWGVVQAREYIEGKDGDGEPEFDYLGYALCRIEGFRRELRALGVLPVAP
ncbi:kinase-like domain-containing protein [Daedaleopsis nitida]|nr:kinase-like domain-containing protein [Daedaleopsis nitida]